MVERGGLGAQAAVIWSQAPNVECRITLPDDAAPSTMVRGSHLVLGGYPRSPRRWDAAPQAGDQRRRPNVTGASLAPVIALQPCQKKQLALATQPAIPEPAALYWLTVLAMVFDQAQPGDVTREPIVLVELGDAADLTLGEGGQGSKDKMVDNVIAALIGPWVGLLGTLGLLACVVVAAHRSRP
jgi:hypothetical protein